MPPPVPNPINGDTKPATSNYASTAGFKRNNPGNIVVQTISYLGKSTVQPKSGPIEFCDMKSGLRALARTIVRKSSHVKTLAGFVNEYCPPDDGKNPALKGNNSDAYLKALRYWSGKAATDILAWDTDLRCKVMRGIICVEIGSDSVNGITDDQIKEAMGLAEGADSDYTPACGVGAPAATAT